MSITIENVMQSNLDLLNEQEKQLLDLLDKIKRAKSLFGGSSKRRGRPRGNSPVTNKTTAATKSTGRGQRKGKATYMEQIVAVLDKNGKMKPAQIIKAVAQMRGKDVKKTGYSIYPLLGPAAKAKKLVRRKGWYSLK